MAIGGDGVVIALHGVEGEAEVVEGFGRSGEEGDGFFDEVGGFGGAIHLEIGDAEEMQGVGILGLDGEDLFIERRGGGEAAALVMLECLLKCLFDRHGRCHFLSNSEKVWGIGESKAMRLPELGCSSVKWDACRASRPGVSPVAPNWVDLR